MVVGVGVAVGTGVMVAVASSITAFFFSPDGASLDVESEQLVSNKVKLSNKIRYIFFIRFPNYVEL